MGDNVNANATATATTQYVFMFLLFEILLQFLLLVSVLDMFCSTSLEHMLFSLLDCMTCFISIIIVMFYLLFPWIKSYGKLLIFPTIQKPYFRQFTPSGFAASMKTPPFEGVNYKRWRTRAVLWFQTMSCYNAIQGKPEGELTPAQEESFEKVNAMFKAALFSVLADNIVDPYMTFDHGKDAWDALDAKFGAPDAGTELYVMEQFYDYTMTGERNIVEQTHEIQSSAKELEQFKCTLPDKFVAGGIIAKLPPSWRNFATSLKHKRHEFFFSDIIGSLHVEENARAKDTHA